MVCAALARDATAVELGLDRLAALDIAADPNLAGLARAAVAGTRFTLRPPVADDALLLPLLRSVPLDLDAAAVASLPVPARKALADNPGLASAARAAVVAPARPGPSIRPELNGAAPADWAAAAGRRSAGAARPLGGTGRRARRGDPRYGLERAPPDRGAGSRTGAEPVPVARLRARRACRSSGGRSLLFVLLLLDGRPEAAAPGHLAARARRPARAGPGARCARARGRHRRGLGPVTPHPRRLPRDDGGRARCRAPHARRLPPRPRRLLGLPRPARQGPAGGRRRRHPGLSRGADRRRPAALDHRPAAGGDPPVFPLPVPRGQPLATTPRRRSTGRARAAACPSCWRSARSRR